MPELEQENLDNETAKEVIGCLIALMKDIHAENGKKLANPYRVVFSRTLDADNDPAFRIVINDKTITLDCFWWPTPY